MKSNLRILEMYLTVSTLSFQLLRVYVDENERGKKLHEEFNISFDFQNARQESPAFNLGVTVHPSQEGCLATFIDQLKELDHTITTINQIVSEAKETAMTQVKALS